MAWKRKSDDVQVPTPSDKPSVEKLQQDIFESEKKLAEMKKTVDTKKDEWTIVSIPTQTELVFEQASTGKHIRLHEAICELLNRTE